MKASSPGTVSAQLPSSLKSTSWSNVFSKPLSTIYDPSTRKIVSKIARDFENREQAALKSFQLPHCFFFF